MKLGKPFATIAVTWVGLSLGTLVIQARTCSGNGDVVGSYGFTGSRSGFFLVGATPPGSTSGIGSGPLIPVAVTPPGTSGAGVSGSNTPMGNLVAGLSKTAQFSSCSNASLAGNYGVTGEGLFSLSAGNGLGGTGSGTSGTPALTGAFTSGAGGPLGTPFNLLGRFVADGSGNLGIVMK